MSQSFSFSGQVIVNSLSAHDTDCRSEDQYDTINTDPSDLPRREARTAQRQDLQRMNPWNESKATPGMTPVTTSRPIRKASTIAPTPQRAAATNQQSKSASMRMSLNTFVHVIISNHPLARIWIHTLSHMSANSDPWMRTAATFASLPMLACSDMSVRCTAYTTMESTHTSASFQDASELARTTAFHDDGTNVIT